MTPEEAGFIPDKLIQVEAWLDEHAGARGYRFALVKDGYLVSALNRGYDPNEPLRIASAAKSFYGSVLGIAVAEARIPSADAPVADIYPEMLDVPAGEGPKEGRYAFPKDRAITYRQLISNTSGYMKPGEAPGRVFHYQTYGMNILTHAIATAYGRYDVADPEGSVGFASLIDEKLAAPIGATFDYSLTNFDLHPRARLPIFGYYCQVHTTPLDFARAGWLWCNWGRWEGQQVVPEAWVRAAVKVNGDLIDHAPPEQWMYGYGFWTNERGVLWPDLPHTAFAAAGAGGHYATVFPDLRLVVVQNPGPYHNAREGASLANGDLLSLVLAGLRV